MRTYTQQQQQQQQQDIMVKQDHLPHRHALFAIRDMYTHPMPVSVVHTDSCEARLSHRARILYERFSPSLLWRCWLLLLPLLQTHR